ncbi:MAG: SRPBCC family protein [Myxococcales bacterium]|nr:SRPBCC family protein [Myxococcales bacterium]
MNASTADSPTPSHLPDVAELPLDPQLDLRLVRELPVSAAQAWAAYTQPALLQQWFCPRPWTVSHCEVDPRPGGTFLAVMRSPEGENQPAVAGCVLVAEPDRRLVWTDAVGPGFRPREGGFMTATIEFTPTATGCRYTATVRHATAEACRQHAEMGFEQGWGAALDQLVALMQA